MKRSIPKRPHADPTPPDQGEDQVGLEGDTDPPSPSRPNEYSSLPARPKPCSFPVRGSDSRTPRGSLSGSSRGRPRAPHPAWTNDLPRVRVQDDAGADEQTCDQVEARAATIGRGADASRRLGRVAELLGARVEDREQGGLSAGVPTATRTAPGANARQAVARLGKHLRRPTPRCRRTRPRARARRDQAGHARLPAHEGRHRGEDDQRLRIAPGEQRRLPKRARSGALGGSRQATVCATRGPGHGADQGQEHQPGAPGSTRRSGASGSIDPAARACRGRAQADSPAACSSPASSATRP